MRKVLPSMNSVGSGNLSSLAHCIPGAGLPPIESGDRMSYSDHPSQLGENYAEATWSLQRMFQYS